MMAACCEFSPRAGETRWLILNLCLTGFSSSGQIGGTLMKCSLLTAPGLSINKQYLCCSFLKYYFMLHSIGKILSLDKQIWIFIQNLILMLFFFFFCYCHIITEKSYLVHKSLTLLSQIKCEVYIIFHI